jgi:hypothetical protein
MVEDQRLRLLRGHESVYALATSALRERIPLAEAARRSAADDALDYGSVYDGASLWRLLPPIDHPFEPARCLVSGTGLTHLRSAANRQAMHAAGEPVTDSMRMYEWGVEGGKPAPDSIGAAPEWFYKGTGTTLRGHNDPLEIPPHAEDGGEEPEIAGAYLIDADGAPRRIGMMAGNEFSDHRFEKRNYLYLAASKLRTCAIGPELVTDPEFDEIEGEVSIERGGAAIWRKRIRTGESAMCHSLRNLEHHHFKFEAHRRPGDVHVHFFGADAFSFGEGIRLENGDWMQVRWDGFGRPLRNRVCVAATGMTPVKALPL